MKALLLSLLFVGVFGSPARRPLFRRGAPQIVGGTEATPGEFPYQLSFQDIYFGLKFHFCGASIYDEINYITAAHCVYGEDYSHPKNLQIVAGEVNLKIQSWNEQASKVVQIAIHPEFSNSTLNNDIAILKGDTPLIFNEFVAPIKLPERGQETSGTCTVTGWGTLYSNGPSPSVLQKVDIPVVSDEQCKKAYGWRKITNSMICAGKKGKDSCQGDSGGPLKCDDYLGGIVSWGIGCGEAAYPGVYTQVSHFIDWINDNLF